MQGTDKQACKHCSEQGHAHELVYKVGAGEWYWRFTCSYCKRPWEAKAGQTGLLRLDWFKRNVMSPEGAYSAARVANPFD